MTTQTDKSEFDNPNISALLSQIKGLVGELSACQCQLTDLLAQVEKSGERCEKLSTDKRRLADENAELKALLIKRREQIDKANADGAVMRGALEKWKAYESADIPKNADQQEALGEKFTEVWFDTEKALSTSCGFDLLDRYREAVELLKLAPLDPCPVDWEWHKRRDTLLDTVKGDL